MHGEGPDTHIQSWVGQGEGVGGRGRKFRSIILLWIKLGEMCHRKLISEHHLPGLSLVSPIHMYEAFTVLDTMLRPENGI